MRILELPCTLQNDMTLERVVACVLIVEPSIDGADLTFSAQLDNESQTGSPESGEFLDCVSWEASGWALSLGTEDGDALSQRLKCLNIESSPYPISYSRSGLELLLTELERGKALSFHFIVAYKSLPDDRECSTWFAVDVPHEVANKACTRQARDGSVKWHGEA
ncbi:hypothetical protein B9K09_01495 [Pseudomonas sp. M30-35]|nr:hypothetical protein B9K09_01495 [Pseudomonas sp. M30-35]